MSQGLPSLQAVPSGAVEFEHRPLVGSQVPATWHWSLAVHVTGLEPVQLPAAHAYDWKHGLVPVQAVPSAAAGLEHPATGSHVPAVWHWSLAVQATGLDPVQVPLTHAKLWRHASVPEQVVPSEAAGLEQPPVVGLHVPAEWHSVGTHVIGVPEQMPARQVSLKLQRFPSLHPMPSSIGVPAHVPVVGLHTLSWHGPAGGHVTGLEATQ